MPKTLEQQKNENENSPNTSPQPLPAGTTIQPVVTGSGITAGGNVNLINHVNITVSASLTPEQKREERHQEITFQLQKEREKRLEDKNIQADLATYVPVQGGRSFEDTQLFDMADKVNNFLESDKKVLLLLGDAGMGKSLFLEYLEKALLQSYARHQAYPLFISLPNVKEPIHHVLENHFDQMGLKSTQIALLRQHYAFIVMLDGYDEIPNHRPDNLYVSNQLSHWHCKVIITCRSQYLLTKKEVYQNRFLPDFRGQPEPGLYEEIVLKPFTPSQRDSYLQKFVEVEKPLWSDWKRYQEWIEKIPDLNALIETPFILRITVEVLPGIASRYETTPADKRIGLTRAGLYDVFAQRWFTREELRLKKQGSLTDPEWDIKVDFRKFSKKLAMALFQKGITEVILVSKTKSYFDDDVSETENVNEWDKFFGADKKLEMIRSGCPLKKVGENGYAFIHKSVQEYFAASQTFDQVATLKTMEPTPPSMPSLSPSPNLGYAKEEIIKKKENLPILPSMLSTQLKRLDINQKLLNEEPSIISFLADLVKADENVKQSLLAIVMQSKREKMIAVAAANAMTILNAARVSFSGMDLSHVNIAGADLSYGVFDHTDFSYANLSNVNLTQVWLRGSNLFQTQIQGVQFGMRPYLKHENRIHAIAYSRDGRYLAVASENHIVMWDQATSEKIKTLVGHKDSITSLSYSHDGRYIVSGSDDKTVRVWDIERGTARIFKGHTGKVYSVAYSLDGRYIVSGGDDKTLRVWDIEKGTSRTFTGHTNSVASVAYSPDSRHITSGSHDLTVRTWDIERGTSRAFTGHTDAVWSVAYSPDGRYIVSGSSDKTVRVWNSEIGSARTLTRHTGLVKSVAYSPDGRYIVSGSEDQTVRVWDIESGTSRTLTGHTYLVTSVAYSPDSRYITSGSHDLTVRTWDIERGASRTLTGHTEYVWSVASSPDGRYIVSGSSDKTVRVWNIESDTSCTFTGHTDAVTSVVYSSDGRYIMSGSSDKTVRIWDIERGAARTFTGHTDAVTSVAYSLDGRYIVSGSWDNTIRVWNIERGISCTFTEHTDMVNSVAYSPDGRHIASGSDDKTVRVWDIERGTARIFKGHTAKVYSVAYSPDGRHIVSGSWDNSVRVWDTERGTSRAFTGHTDFVWSVAYSPDGRYIVSGSTDYTVRVWDFESGECLAILRGYLSSVESVCFVNNNLIATANSDCSVKVWERVDTPTEKNRWQLRWSSHVSFYCEDTNIELTQGLTAEQQKLLHQNGAKGKPALTDINNNNNAPTNRAYSPMWNPPPSSTSINRQTQQQPKENTSSHKENLYFR